MKVSPRSIWLLLLFALKILQFLYFTALFHENWPENRRIGAVFISEGETRTFYEPMENLIHGNGYSSLFVSEYEDLVEMRPSTRRMPGLVPLYVPLRLFFDEALSKNFIILLQLCMTLLCILLMGQIAELLFSKPFAFYIASALFTVSSFTSIYDHYGLGESFSISFSILALWFYLSARKDSSPPWYILAAGFFIAWSTFMRPAMLLLGILMASDLLLSSSSMRVHWKSLALKTLILLFPGLFFLGIWVARNYVHTNKIILLEDSIYESLPSTYPPQRKELRNLIKRLGGNYKPFYPQTMGQWFTDSASAHDPFNDLSQFSSLSYQHLEQLRRLYLKSVDQQLSRETRETNKRHFIASAQSSVEQIRDEHPFYYHITSRLKAISRLIFIPTDPSLPFPERAQLTAFQFVLKVGFLLLYNILVLLGLLGLITYALSSFKQSAPRHVSLLSFPLVYILIVGGVLFNIEYRYLAPIYPFWILLTTLFFIKIRSILNRNLHIGPAQR